MRITFLCSIVALVTLLGASAAQAQATRTWVSGVGDDANPCSRTAPCKTFAGAYSKTAVGGEIDVLDPGGFGAVTISKSLSIEAEGTIAGVLVSGTNGIVVQGGSNVVLRGLTIEGLGTGLAGVKFTAGGSLFIENCTINNFTTFGVDFEPNQATNSFLSIKNTSIRNNLGANSGGVLVKPVGGGAVNGILDRVRIENNQVGLRVETGSKVSVRDSQMSNNVGNGVIAVSGEINLEDTEVSNNQGNGLFASNGTIRISNVSIVSNNGASLITAGSGSVLSFINNRIKGNVGGDNAPSATQVQQ
ncbi:MAG TPA: right-handed parallel beta-helix repeat-containing protein [Thermoanaerobaculia bacterium]|nr:right-handed parallel beta-helix repeat-containing protein [Thermoanaerobaculia bacterium]